MKASRSCALTLLVSVGGGCKEARTPMAPIVAPVPSPSIAQPTSPVPPVPSVVLACRAEPRSGPTPLTVKFHASPAGGTGTYDFEWRFGDGTASNQVHPTHTYVSEGLFTASVRVTSGPQEAVCERSITTAARRAPGPGPGPGPKPTPLPFPDLVITILGQNGNLSYSPNPASVGVGQRVVWRNVDPGMPHTATAAGGAFNTGLLGSGASSPPITMGAEGNFAYFCGLHPSMTGTLAVTR